MNWKPPFSNNFETTFWIMVGDCNLKFTALYWLQLKMSPHFNAEMARVTCRNDWTERKPRDSPNLVLYWASAAEGNSSDCFRAGIEQWMMDTKNSRKAWRQERYIQSQVNILTKVQDSKKFCFVSWTCLCFFYWNTDLFTCDCDILVFYVHILAFFNHRYRLWLKHLFPSLRVCFLSSTS